MKREKISEAIENIDEKYIIEAIVHEDKKVEKSKSVIKWGVLVAAIAIITVISMALYQNVSKKESGHRAKLEDGSVISFAENKSLYASEIKIAADGRELTRDEIGSVFGGLNITDAEGYFSLEDGSVMGVSGKLGDIQIMVSAPGKIIRDCFINGKTETSYVKGIPVLAGYVTTNENQNIIYFATLELSESSVYLEHKGSYDDRNIIRKEIADAIQDVAQLGEIELEYITSIENMIFDME